jgi:hypothetical protein
MTKRTPFYHIFKFPALPSPIRTIRSMIASKRMSIGASNKTINGMAVMTVSIWETDEVQASDNVVSAGLSQYALTINLSLAAIEFPGQPLFPSYSLQQQFLFRSAADGTGRELSSIGGCGAVGVVLAVDSEVKEIVFVEKIFLFCDSGMHQTVVVVPSAPIAEWDTPKLIDIGNSWETFHAKAVTAAAGM